VFHHADVIDNSMVEKTPRAVRYAALLGPLILAHCGDQDSTRLWLADSDSAASSPSPSSPASTAPLPGASSSPDAPWVPASESPPAASSDADPSAEVDPEAPWPAGSIDGAGGPSEPLEPSAPDDEWPGEIASAIERAPLATLSLPASLEVSPRGWTTEVAFPALTFDDPVGLSEAPGTGHLFVLEREGRIYAFENDPAATEKRLVLDLSARTQGNGDSGLLGLAFHPEFGEPGLAGAGYVYVHYAFRTGRIIPTTPASDTSTVSRLARFTIDLATLTVDPMSELVLIDQADDSVWHQGGAMFFHPTDGFLYLAVGDEGDVNCSLGNCQVLDKDLFSGVLRIDVDSRGGDISHPIAKQPATGSTANYFIPNDNPFVGLPGALEEFYALGLRSPHRMTHDAVDGITWIGDVGQAQREELNVLAKGANFQWNTFEGTQPGALPMPASPLGRWTAPVLELERREASSIIGGYVYRGPSHPDLQGKYIFGDFATGNVWALSYACDGERLNVTERELLMRTAFRNRQDGLTSFGVDRNQELYLLMLGATAQIHRLARTAGFSNAPLQLSDTGVFRDTASVVLEPSSGFVPYAVQSPLWSDGAIKRRWVAVPDGQSARFAETGAWTFPRGSVFVKHFELATDEARPDLLRRIETRLLVGGARGEYYGVTYRWNEAGTDAELVIEAQTEAIDVLLADHTTRHLRYFYPGPDDCGTCHHAEAGSVLGARTAQLNGEMQYPNGHIQNQLYAWSAAGMLDTALRGTDVARLQRLAAPDDETASLADRVRAYWAGNCSMCHGSLSDIRASWDARQETPLDEQGVILGPSQSATESGAVLIEPGDPGGSVLYGRSASDEPGVAMPPLGRSAADPAYVALLERWIRSLAPRAGD
jgi:uncharacterized repeat protein (TIGR03806 family)